MSTLTLDAVPPRTVDWMTSRQWTESWLSANERLHEKNILRDPTEAEVIHAFEILEDEWDHADSGLYPQEVSA